MKTTRQPKVGEERRGRVTGYRLVVPNEWQKIPVQKGTDQAIDAFLDRALARHGRDQVAQYRREMATRLKKLAAQARENAGVDLYLPLGNRERNLPASFMVSFVEFGSLSAPDSRYVLDEVISTTDGAVAIEFCGGSAIRAERVYAAAPERGVDLPTRRVEYIVPVPGVKDSWLISSFSTVGAGSPGDDISKLLCALFDAIMTTFAWNYDTEIS
jgi:hypothetical protein